MPKNIVLNSLKESFAAIWSNKSLFFLLVAIQIIFFVSLFFLSSFYFTKILFHSKEISDYISLLKLDDVSVAANVLEQKNLLGEDPLLISRNFSEIVKNFKLYLFYTFILLILFMSMLWSITLRLIYKDKFRQLLRIFSRNFIVALFYLGMIFLFFYSILNVSLFELAAEGIGLFKKYIPFLILSPILIYFMFISISLVHKVELKNIVQKTLSIGIKKIHYILAAYFLNILFFGISSFFYVYFIERNLFIMSLGMIFAILSFVFGRIFMIKVVDKISTV